ncbi:FxLYD domain-containing protein [Halalkalicoccus sp. NIPERK01]|uniref:FxLYD domain-containing protein n=1 Tax=Halalkalicoccus sp. NIPERK01 TaxID=3053469 RepID=UPI00256EB36E|nr:FxLYD domain-containing protein [Halalkalicoccus sp. NIPERK01]MDL5362683.1 FxLYD domain-containing protein [Halalkalicoccus sp. NIPERK01]
MTRQCASRRRFLALAGTTTSAAVGLAGCLGSGSGSTGQPAYESGDVPDDIDGEERTTQETTAAEAAAEVTPRDDLAPLDGLSIEDHEFVFESGYAGSTVQGTVENTSGERVGTAEVRVRVYNSDDQVLGLYLDSTGDLDGGAEWSFQVILLESPADIADYDITVVGLPD